MITERILVTTDLSAAGDCAVRAAANWARVEVVLIPPERSNLPWLDWATRH